MKKIYLAGPDVFVKNAKELGIRKRALCDKYGYEGLFPLDNEVDFSVPNPDKVIFKGNIKMIRDADMGIFNLTPFRGASADVGTVFELGMMYGLGKPCYAYTNKYGDYLSRLYGENGRYDTEKKIFVDKDNMLIENFNNIDNLMIDNSLRCFVTPSCKGVSFGEQNTIQRLERFEKVLMYIQKEEKNAK